jgi:hypothetical protein
MFALVNRDNKEDVDKNTSPPQLYTALTQQGNLVGRAWGAGTIFNSFSFSRGVLERYEARERLSSPIMDA